MRPAEAINEPKVEEVKAEVGEPEEAEFQENEIADDMVEKGDAEGNGSIPDTGRKPMHTVYTRVRESTCEFTCNVFMFYDISILLQ